MDLIFLKNMCLDFFVVNVKKKDNCIFKCIDLYIIIMLNM